MCAMPGTWSRPLHLGEIVAVAGAERGAGGAGSGPGA